MLSFWQSLIGLPKAYQSIKVGKRGNVFLPLIKGNSETSKVRGTILQLQYILTNKNLANKNYLSSMRSCNPSCNPCSPLLCRVLFTPEVEPELPETEELSNLLSAIVSGLDIILKVALNPEFIVHLTNHRWFCHRLTDRAFIYESLELGTGLLHFSSTSPGVRIVLD